MEFTKSKSIFDFILNNFINMQIDVEDAKKNVNEDILFGFLKKNFIDGSSNEEFLGKLPNLNEFLRSYFKLKFYGLDFDYKIMSSMPILFSDSGSLSTEMYFIFLISNPHIYYRKFGFKLFDSKKDGLNISLACHAFLGFTGSVAIIIHHWEKEENKEYIFGGYLNSNIREGNSGGENSYVFSLFPEFNFYLAENYSDSNAYIISKSSPPFVRQPGIGFGEYKNKFRLWIDAKNLGASYFLKFDDIFKEGSPFQETEKFLNIINFEIFGFGDDNDYNNLMIKHGKEKIMLEKMKKVDKKLVAESEYDKEIFLSKTFSHQQYGRKSSLEN
jgi:hypothetical protein